MGATEQLESRTCAKCSHENRPHRRFCGVCASGLVIACHRCSFANDLDDAYCGMCAGQLTDVNAVRSPDGDDQQPGAPVRAGPEDGDDDDKPRSLPASNRRAPVPQPPQGTDPKLDSDASADGMKARLLDLNKRKVRRVGASPPTPPPIPQDDDDLGQDTIDEMFT